MLTAQDDLIGHQLPTTFDHVGNSNPASMERLWYTGHPRSGERIFDIGLGYHPNRNVMDAFAGVSVGNRQINFRASRRLRPNPLETAVGPLKIEVLEGLKRSRMDPDVLRHVRGARSAIAGWISAAQVDPLAALTPCSRSSSTTGRRVRGPETDTQHDWASYYDTGHNPFFRLSYEAWTRRRRPKAIGHGSGSLKPPRPPFVRAGSIAWGYATS